jgi:hypothetical protein
MLDSILLADISSINPSPYTAAYSVIEYVVKKEHKPTHVLSPEKIKKFEEQAKEDFYKDDTHKNMWDPNWIKKKD